MVQTDENELKLREASSPVGFDKRFLLLQGPWSLPHLGIQVIEPAATDATGAAQS